MTTKQEVLKNCTKKENVVYLPEGQLDRKLYNEVADALGLIGGKWKGGKVMGFQFKENPEYLLKAISEGEQINLKKQYQFFPKPRELAMEMVSFADIKNLDCILEPSAGQGAIINEILNYIGEYSLNTTLHYVELMDINRNILEKKYSGLDHIKRLSPAGNDFLNLDPDFKEFEGYDKIIANPPFAKNQDIDHIRKMYDCLKPGGRIVTISSKHWVNSKNKKEMDFAAWLYDTCEADVNGIDAGTFSESGTKIETLILIIDKKI